MARDVDHFKKLKSYVKAVGYGGCLMGGGVGGREGGREGGKEGGREGGKEGGREGGM